MANNKSAKKRIEINERNRIRNRYYKSSVKTLTKTFFKDLENYKNFSNLKDKENLKKTLSLVYGLMDKGTKKNVFHKNTIARKKAKLAYCLKSV